MLSKSSGLALTFVLVAALLVGVYASGTFASVLAASGCPEILTDPMAIVALAAITVVSLALGGQPLMIMGAATVTAFIILTLNQDILIRYLTLAAVLFSIGMYGMVVSRNAVRVLMSIELMLNAVNINLVAFARYIDPVYVRGQLFAIFILTVAAAEAAVGLAIVLAIYRNMSTVDMEKFNLLKW